MPTYLYRCKLESCQHEFETYHSIKADYLVNCPHCEQPTLSVIPFAVGVLVKDEPKTIGSLAEKNTDKLGRYGREDLWAKIDQNKKDAKEAAREELSKKLPSGASLPEIPNSPIKIGGVDISKPNPRLNELNKEQKIKYIHEGKLP
jgi:putative FmdB family regulatory protein